MSRRHSPWSATLSLIAVSSAGCIDWNSHTRSNRDAGGPGDGAEEGGDAGEDAGPDADGSVTTDAGEVALDDGGVSPDADASAADDASAPGDASASNDAGAPDESGPCPASACPAAFPCVGTAASYTCRGQFADFPVPVRAYTEGTFPELLIEDDLVFDQRTGLSWERVGLTSRINFLDAQSYCTNLRLGSHTDFRVPYLQEIITLYGAVETPGYDSTLFIEWDPSIGLFTSTPSSEQQYYHFSIGEGNIYASPQPDDGSARVRCVRTQESRISGTPTTRFEALAGSAWIRDNVTKLVWEADVPLARAQQSKQQADAHCASLTTAERTFQLPTPAESLSIIDYSKVATKRLAPGFTTRADSTWTSAHDGDKTSTLIVIVLNDGSVKSVDTASTDRAGTRCVSRE